MTIDPQFTWANAMTAGAMLVGLVVHWATMRSQILRMEEKIAELQRHRDGHDARLREVERGYVAISAKLDGLTAMVADIREAVRNGRP